MKNAVMIRPVTIEDAERVLEIYAYYTKETAISFEYEVPTLEEFRGRIQKTLQKYPYLVIEENGRIQGYTYAYTKETAISFEYEVPTLEEFRGRIQKTLQKYPYLVIEENGRIQGYTYAGPFVGRAAYDWSAELTIYLDKDAKKRGYGYLDKDAKKRGYGRKLYEAIEQKLKEMGILNN